MLSSTVLIIIALSILGFLYATTFDTPAYLYSFSMFRSPRSIAEIARSDYSCLGEYSTKLKEPLYTWLLSVLHELCTVVSFDESKDIVNKWYQESVKDPDNIIREIVDKALKDAESFNAWKVDSIKLIDIQNIPSIIARNDYVDCHKLLEVTNEYLTPNEEVTLSG